LWDSKVFKLNKYPNNIYEEINKNTDINTNIELTNIESKITEEDFDNS